jgi:hypothetical protein
MARDSRIHAPAPDQIRRRRKGKLDANGPIAPQILALRRAFRPEKPVRRSIADAAPPNSQTLISARNLLGCHGISGVKEGLGHPRKPVRLFTT